MKQREERMEKNSREWWDAAANDYQKVYAAGQDEYNEKLVAFLRDELGLRGGIKVLDIGCGVGTFGTMFAAMGCDVTLTDISSEMLRHASENMSPFGTPWKTVQGDFGGFEDPSSVLGGPFDLTISTMSPAVRDERTVRMMSELTDGYCFVTRFSSWSQPLRDSVLRSIGREPQVMMENAADECEAFLGEVMKAGYRPESMNVDYSWSDLRTPSEMAQYLSFRYGEEPGSDFYLAVEKASEGLASAAGEVDDTVNTTVMWIWWKTV